MTRVQYRWLQLVTSRVAGDRVSVALAHWDGQHLRTMVSGASLPPWMREDRADIEDAVSSALAKLRGSMRRASAATEPLGFDIFESRGAGEGGALTWSPTVVEKTIDTKGHFDELAAELHLSDHSDSRRTTALRLDRRLIDMAKPLRDANPERVRVRMPIRRWATYTPPVSWLNRVWHHVMSLNLATEQRRDAGVLALIGAATGAIPENEVACALLTTAAAEPSDDERAAIAGVTEALRGGGGEVIVATDATAAAKSLRTRIIADIAQVHV